MTAISLGQVARPSRLGRTRDSGGYFVGPARVREQFEVTNATSRPKEFAGGFVDFLLGRGGRHPR
jgi:hypothetical protein